MIIYNVTVNIHESVHQQWLIWMQQTHIPAMLATQKFSAARLAKVLIEEEMGGTTYATQYTTDSMETLQQYYVQNAPKLRDEAQQLFGDKMLAFRTELEVLADF
jgi:phosphoribosylamine-glycine ligase